MKNKKRRQPTPNPVLEAAFQCGKLDYKSLCSHTGLSDRQISVWMRLRNHVGKSVLCLPGQVLHSYVSDLHHLISFRSHFGGGHSIFWHTSIVFGLWRTNPGSGTHWSVGTAIPNTLLVPKTEMIFW